RQKLVLPGQRLRLLAERGLVERIDQRQDVAPGGPDGFRGDAVLVQPGQAGHGQSQEGHPRQDAVHGWFPGWNGPRHGGAAAPREGGRDAAAGGGYSRKMAWQSTQVLLSLVAVVLTFIGSPLLRAAMNSSLLESIRSLNFFQSLGSLPATFFFGM